MICENFNHDWEVVTTEKSFPFRTSRMAVTLPYDDMLNTERSPDVPGGAGSGFYPERVCTLEKKFMVPKEWENQKILLEFEGVYANSMVYINREYAGGCSHGYTNFTVDTDGFLQYGQENEIKVVARSSVDSRWYTGVGIYRNVNLWRGDSVFVKANGLRVHTEEVDDEGAMVCIAIALENIQRQPQMVSVEAEILDQKGQVLAKGTEPITLFQGKTASLHQRLYLKRPKRWSVDDPYLYQVCITVKKEAAVMDYVEESFGIRTMSLDVVHGLRINGESIKLRGACVHHDNGLLGAADIARAEERRVRLLKGAGFNAVRSAHNPASKAFLQACDKYGMLVMDELSDMWTQSKTDFDYAPLFLDHWQMMVEAMVEKDYNHPCVIMYSIGNEIPEISSPHGADLGRKIAQKFKTLDATRYTINSMNLIMASMGKFSMAELMEQANSNVNDVMTNLGDRIDAVANSQVVTDAVRESLAATDIIGYNYATGRYEDDRERLPNHVLCGSETYPNKIAENWEIIKNNPHVIGDFTWTGWDYIGEAGVGQIRYREDSEKFEGYRGGYPCFLAYCGDIDILGHRRPMSYYREIVFGLRQEPYMAVEYPWQHGKTPMTNKWAFFDGISSWSWHGYEGKEVIVQVYAPGDSIVLYHDDCLLEEKKLDHFKAEFSIQYQPGALKAVAIKDGKAMGEFCLHTASDQLQMRVTADRTELTNSEQDLAYLDIDITDEQGILQNMADRDVTVRVEGAGELLGLGSANPMGKDSFRTATARSFDGRLQAIIRPLAVGTVKVVVNAAGMEEKYMTLQVHE